VENNLFVARDAQLKQLITSLDKALAGQSQICFIAGEAGAGKTSLVQAFIQQAINVHDELIVVETQCNSQTGTSDPYLPFRRLLEALTGKLNSSLKTKDSGKLKNFFRRSGKLLVDVAPDLAGAVLPGANIVAVIARSVADQLGLLKKIEEQAKDSPDSLQLNRAQIVEQCTSYFKKLTQRYPLLIILDDLHWVDGASADLLFDLSREMKTSRILIVGLYRPEDVALPQNGEPHPMARVLNEIKRYKGNVIIDLNEIQEAQKYTFVDAILNADKNHLDDEFRIKLADHTGGNALFVVELLEYMIDQGYLQKDAAGYLVPSPQLSWSELPDKVEAVLDKKILLLSEELQRTLKIASVEGDDFTAQVLARLRQVNELNLLNQLSTELEKRHRLVLETRPLVLGSQTLARFRFRHALLKDYLYGQLGLTERRLLHLQVADLLKELYAERLDEVALQLGEHYAIAGKQQEAALFLKQAGEYALRIGALKEAQSALEKSSHLSLDDSMNVVTLNLLGTAFLYAGMYQQAKANYQESLRLAESLGEETAKANALHGLGNVEHMLGQYDEAIDQFKATFAIVEPLKNPRLEAQIRASAGSTYRDIGQYAESILQYEKASVFAKEAKDQNLEVVSLTNLGSTYIYLGEYQQALEYYEAALQLNQLNPYHESRALMGIGTANHYMGNYDLAQASYTKALKTAQKIGDRRDASIIHARLGHLYADKFQLDKAIEYNTEGQSIAQSIGAQSSEQYCLAGLGEAYVLMGDYKKALKNLQLASEIAAKTKRLPQLHRENTTIAEVYLATNKLKLALEKISSIRAFSSPWNDYRASAIHSVILARLGKRQEALESAHEAVRLSKKLLEKTPQHYGAKYILGLAFVTLAIVSEPDSQDGFISQAKEAYQAALQNCDGRGVIRLARHRLEQLDAIDTLNRTDSIKIVLKR
jgi:adenylate cyclase